MQSKEKVSDIGFKHSILDSFCCQLSTFTLKLMDMEQSSFKDSETVKMNGKPLEICNNVDHFFISLTTKQFPTKNMNNLQLMLPVGIGYP